ncbi:MAG TPA: peptidase T [Vicinamibacterales bacterium]|nr:peptidase T [Vicinamibacterales bacterium]
MSQPLTSNAADRFLRYVAFDTQSDEQSETYPSTAKQLVLLEHLVAELKAIGVADASIDQYGYVMATIPPTPGKEQVPAIGFIAHVDTSPEVSGANVKPIVHKNYDGRDLVLPDDPAMVLREKDNPELAEQRGNDIITASGLTLLGSDDKSGVAEIMAAAEYLVSHPEIPHGAVKIGFTPDEEVGRGTQYFDVNRFGARFAYTLDGPRCGELEIENFSADAMTIAFQGFNAHPGYAKGRMVSALKLASEFVHRLPRHGLSPETTEGYEGYVHPHTIQGGVERAAVKLLLRDFTTKGLDDKARMLTDLAEEVVRPFPAASVEIERRESYRNMKEVLDRYPEVMDHAKTAMTRAGLTPHFRQIRGGTDGARLSFMGLPTPNLFAGEHNIHSRLEWTSVQDMDKAVEVIVEICRSWAEGQR